MSHCASLRKFINYLDTFQILVELKLTLGRQTQSKYSQYITNNITKNINKMLWEQRSIRHLFSRGKSEYYASVKELADNSVSKTGKGFQVALQCIEYYNMGQL